MILELTVTEQRYHAVLEVLVAGVSVTAVAERYGVSRQSVHTWIHRYEDGGLAGLADQSRRPHGHPRQVDAKVEELICELRRTHHRWGPRRLVYELTKNHGVAELSRSTVYRVLVRNHLVDAKARKRRREDYARWERPVPMELWQLDIMGSVMLADGTEAKLISGLDDHSRFCVIARLVMRATGRAVCAAFADALREYGVPDEVLTDNGKQFTGRLGRPRPAEVLFERICRENGIVQRLTKVASPTTTGKVERWHQSIQTELVGDSGPFADLAAAQAAVDAWRNEYNNVRPHQSLGMATPAARFKPIPEAERKALPLRLPANLSEAPAPPPTPRPAPEAEVVPEVVEAPPVVVYPDAVEIERVVPGCGNLRVLGQQFWIGPALAGAVLRLWIDPISVHLSVAGRRLKTLPSRLSTNDIARLRAEGGAAAGPPPAMPSAGALLADAAIEVERSVNAIGLVGLGRRQIQVGQVLAGRRVTLRLEGEMIHVVVDGVLARTVASPFTAEQRARLAGARLAGPPPRIDTAPVRVQRTVSARGTIQVVKQKVQVGLPHARTIVTVLIHEAAMQVLNDDGDAILVVPRTTTGEVNRFKAFGKVRSS
jgi:transposase InsO family protein